MKKLPVTVGVIGSGECSEELSSLAREVGREIARRGGILICGGLGGVMEAACEGAKEEGGLTIGILPGTSREDANPYVDIPIATGLSDARNVIIVRSSDVLIAVGGRWGTLSEIAFALKFGKPVVCLKGWDMLPDVHRALDPVDAVEKAWSISVKS